MDNIGLDPTFSPSPRRTGLRSWITRMGLGAFAISLIVHIIFALIAIFFLYKWIYPPPEKLDEFIPGGGGGTGGETLHKVQQQKRMMNNTAVSKRISSTSTTALFSLPDSSDEMMDPGLPMEAGGLGSGGGSGGGKGKGTGTGTGGGSGPGFGPGNSFGSLIPTIMRGRCSDSERLSMLRQAGGTPEVEAAVKKSLQWLKGRQNPDGSWGKAHAPAMTGLVLLCYLGHCENTQSLEYGENVSKGISYLINVSLKNNGRMAADLTGNGYVYEHAIATYALSEALTFSRNLQFPIPELEPAVVKAANIIIAGQASGGGWDYLYKVSTRNDLSVAGWQMQALKAAKASGVKLDGLDRTISKATGWLSRVAYVGDGRFAYSDTTPHPAMTAVGALCLQQWGKGSSKPVNGAVRLIMDGLKLREKANPKIDPFAPLYSMQYNSPNADLYAWYYAVQVMRNADGKEWDATNKAILADILPAQNSDGSFKPEAGGGPLTHNGGTSGAGGSRDIYLQTLNTLILEVYYRFLPTSAGGSRLSGLDDLR
ncbi:MAG: terpene cyclase/mutase family protein [Armatimonadetes bacterium]|nr:terpene cyclase/mutase family protein [Akkermansiaceae bacterium]